MMTCSALNAIIPPVITFSRAGDEDAALPRAYRLPQRFISLPSLLEISALDASCITMMTVVVGRHDKDGHAH